MPENSDSGMGSLLGDISGGVGQEFMSEIGSDAYG
jgi:hypothetical protein